MRKHIVKTRRPTIARTVRLEALETRTLFNTLVIDGTSGNDTITLGLAPNGDIRATVNGKQTDYKPSDFTDVVVDGQQGDDTINIRATVLPTTVGSHGHAIINIGNTNGVQDIKATLTQTGFPVGPVAPGTAIVNVDDTGDAAARMVTLGSGQFEGKITGLAPADINYDFNPPVVGPAGASTDLPQVQFNALNLTTGSGDDKVNVKFVPSDFPLTLDSSGGNDTVNIGNGGKTADIGSPVGVTNDGGQTALTVDDSGDTTARTITLSVGSNASGLTGTITGLTNPQVGAGIIVPIGNVTFNAAQTSSVTVNGGSGGNTFNVDGTPTSKSGAPGGPTITLNTGTGNDTVNLNATAAGTQLNVNGQGGNDATTISILGVQGDVNLNGDGAGTAGDTLTLETPSPLSEIATPLVVLTAGKVTHGAATIEYQHVENLQLNGGGAFEVNGDLGQIRVQVNAFGPGPTPLIAPITFTSVRVNTSQNLKALEIDSGGVALSTGMDKVLNTGSLVINNGMLDVSDDSLQVHYGDMDPFSQIRSYIFDHKVTSSTADARHNVGYADSADDIVKGLTDKTVLAKFTLLGDANLDGHVGFADLLLLAQHYGKQENANWDQGDFNYDGKVNFADLLLLAQNYGRSLSPPPTAAVAAAASALAPRKRR